MTITDPAEYRRIHDIAAAAYEAAVPVDYRYSALALRKAVDAALSALAPQAGDNAEEPVAWLPIETAPKDGTTILVAAYCDDAQTETVGCAYWPEAEEWFWWHDQEYPLSENGFEARFWQPLPKLPAALASHPCTSTPVVSQNAPALEDKGGDIDTKSSITQLMGVSQAADAYVTERGIEHSAGIIETAFEAGACWATRTALNSAEPHVVGSIDAFERSYPELFYKIGKGKLSPSEPMYGAVIETVDGEPVGEGESDVSLFAAFEAALADSELPVPRGYPRVTEQDVVQALHTIMRANGQDLDQWTGGILPTDEITEAYRAALSTTPEGAK